MMNNHLQGFDPLLFLGINNLQGIEKDKVSKELLDSISRYMAARIIKILPENEVEDLPDDPEKLFAIAKEKIPDIDKTVKKILEDYKKEYNSNDKDILNNHE